MSQTLGLVCHQCKAAAGIGKTLIAGGQVFRDKENLDLIESFLLEHRGHPLEFEDLDQFAYY